MAVSISQTANPAGAGSGTTITYSGQSIGVADANRIVVVCVGAELSSGSPSSATIDYGSGAVAMTPGTLGSQGAVFSRVFYLPAPTGTTADIAITFGASQGSTTHHIAVYRVLGGKFSAESAVGDTDADPISSGVITIPTGGGCIAICSMAADASLRTWAGITEDIDEDAGTFQFTTGTSTTAGTPTITVSGANNEDGALAWLIFAPGYALAIDAGSYAVTGQNVTLSHGYSVSVDAGSYAVTGQDVTLSKGQTLAIDAGSYAVTGQDVTLTHAWVVVPETASYSISGQDVTLTKTSSFSIGADGGSYTISGGDVALEFGRIVLVDGAAYVITGQDVTLTLDTGAPPVSRDPGAGFGGSPRAGRWTRGRWKRLLEELREEKETLRAKAKNSQNKRAKKALRAAAAAVGEVIAAGGLLSQQAEPDTVLQMQGAVDAAIAARGADEMLAAAENTRMIAEAVLRAIEDQESEEVAMLVLLS